MLSSATIVVLALALALQPLTAALCTHRCQSDSASNVEVAPGEHCTESEAKPEADAEPQPPYTGHTPPPHDGDDCEHVSGVCTASEIRRAELNGPLVFPLALIVNPSQANLEPAAVCGQAVTQQTSPPGSTLRIVPLRI